MTRSQRAFLIVGVVLLAFLGGFGWQYVRAESLEAELTAARRDLAFAQLEAVLAAAAVQAHRGDYEAARRLASDFFTGLQADIDRAPADAREELRTVLAERDQLITLLSRADPQGRDRLTAVFTRYRVAVGGPARALPVPAGSAEEMEPSTTPATGAEPEPPST